MWGEKKVHVLLQIICGNFEQTLFLLLLNFHQNTFAEKTETLQLQEEKNLSIFTATHLIAFCIHISLVANRPSCRKSLILIPSTQLEPCK